LISGFMRPREYCCVGMCMDDRSGMVCRRLKAEEGLCGLSLGHTELGRAECGGQVKRIGSPPRRRQRRRMASCPRELEVVAITAGQPRRKIILIIYGQYKYTARPNSKLIYRARPTPLLRCFRGSNRWITCATLLASRRTKEKFRERKVLPSS
jgi:hypothetical protein